MPLTECLRRLDRLALLLAGCVTAMAIGAACAASAGLEKRAGVWVEGPGFDITYGGTYESCAARCISHDRCAMIEFYRPERKCNLYSSIRPQKQGGSSIVGLKTSATR